MIKYFLSFLGILFITGHSFSQEKWYNQNYPSNVVYNCVYFTDANNGWICGSSGTILHTDDAGKNWNMQNSGFNGKLCNLTGICFTDAQNG